MKTRLRNPWATEKPTKVTVEMASHSCIQQIPVEHLSRDQGYKVNKINVVPVFQELKTYACA